MQDDGIAVRLGLPQLKILRQRELEDHIEGKNNRIKTIKRMAYGYRNLDNFRLRILAANPGCEARVSHLLT